MGFSDTLRSFTPPNAGWVNAFAKHPHLPAVATVFSSARTLANRRTAARLPGFDPDRSPAPADQLFTVDRHGCSLGLSTLQGSTAPAPCHRLSPVRSPYDLRWKTARRRCTSGTHRVSISTRTDRSHDQAEREATAWVLRQPSWDFRAASQRRVRVQTPELNRP